MFLSDEDVQELKRTYAEYGFLATEEFVRHFHDYTDEEVNKIKVWFEDKIQIDHNNIIVQ